MIVENIEEALIALAILWSIAAPMFMVPSILTARSFGAKLSISLRNWFLCHIISGGVPLLIMWITTISVWRGTAFHIGHGGPRPDEVYGSITAMGAILALCSWLAFGPVSRIVWGVDGWNHLQLRNYRNKSTLLGFCALLGLICLFWVGASNMQRFDYRVPPGGTRKMWIVYSAPGHDSMLVKCEVVGNRSVLMTSVECCIVSDACDPDCMKI